MVLEGSKEVGLRWSMSAMMGHSHLVITDFLEGQELLVRARAFTLPTKCSRQGRYRFLPDHLNHHCYSVNNSCLHVSMVWCSVREHGSMLLNYACSTRLYRSTQKHCIQCGLFLGKCVKRCLRPFLVMAVSPLSFGAPVCISFGLGSQLKMAIFFTPSLISQYVGGTETPLHRQH